jgi:hypothetical protein
MICPGPVKAMFSPEAREPAVVERTLSDTHAQRAGRPAKTPQVERTRNAYRVLKASPGSAACRC